MNRPPSGKKSKKSAQLLSKEQEFKDLNAALEEKTANLISEAESVLRGQNSLFADLTSTENLESPISLSGYIASQEDTLKSIESKVPPPAKQNKRAANKIAQQRPTSVPSAQTRKKTATKNARTQSSRGAHSHEISPINLIEERTLLADHISTLELEAADELYTPSNMNEEVLPEVTSDIGPEATIRFLKAKLRVMQEELENTVSESRDKSSKISKLEKEIKEKDELELSLHKKNEQLQNTIEKHKSYQDDIRLKNSQLESEISTLKKELESKKRENKQTSANKNTLEVRLNRALEEVEKHKSALQRSKESTKMVNDTDRKKLEQLQNENKRLQKQKSELMTAFKKQLKLIEVLKRQKMHIEAAKLLEFSEEEFIRALDWGKS